MPYKNKLDQIKYQRLWYKNNKVHAKKVIYKGKLRRKTENTEYIKFYLSSHPCVDCGEKDIVTLDFDHVRGKKRKSISLMRSEGFSLETIKKEIEKCEVRCCNCHRKVTRKRFVAGSSNGRTAGLEPVNERSIRSPASNLSVSRVLTFVKL